MSERKRRKLYLGPKQNVNIPRTTLWRYRKRSSSGRPVSGALPTEAHGSETIGGASSSDRHGSDGGDSRCESTLQPTRAGSDAEADIDGASASRDSGEGHANRDEPDSDIPVPAFDETELLAGCVADFGSKTLPGSKTTIAAAVVLIMSFVVAHGLPWTAVNDLLKLVDALFGFENCGLPTTKYLLRKLWLPKCAAVVNYHYYCDVCGSLLKVTANRLRASCDVCLTTATVATIKAAGNFFVILDLKKQFLSLIAQVKGALFDNLCKLREAAIDGCEVMSDITTGAMYQALRRDRLLNWMDLTVVFNTDGSALYKSSNASVWPIQMTVNELPLPLRSRHSVLAGIWFGHKHPDMLLFLGKFVEAMRSVGQLVWRYGTTTLQTRVYAICICVDAPARAAVGNHVQFNGFFGCPWCLSCAKTEDGEYIAEQLASTVILKRNMNAAVVLTGSCVYCRYIDTCCNSSQ